MRPLNAFLLLAQSVDSGDRLEREHCLNRLAALQEDSLLPLLLPCNIDGAALSQGRTGAVHLHLQLGQRTAGQPHHHLPAAVAAAAAGLGAAAAAADSRDPGSAAGTPTGEPRASGAAAAGLSSGSTPGGPMASPTPFGRAPSAPHPLSFSAGVGAGDPGLGFRVGGGPGGTSGGGGGLGAAGGSVPEAYPLGAEGQGGMEGAPMAGAFLGRGAMHERPLQGRRTDPGPGASGGGAPGAGVEGEAGMGAGAEAGGRGHEENAGGGAGPEAPLQLLVGPSQYENLIAMCIGTLEGRIRMEYP